MDQVIRKHSKNFMGQMSFLFFGIANKEKMCTKKIVFFLKRSWFQLLPIRFIGNFGSRFGIQNRRPIAPSATYITLRLGGSKNSLGRILKDILVGGFNPFEKYYIVKMDHFPN